MTFSIVARDPATGELGAATATAGPAVGALVLHGASQTGAIATQALTNPLYGPQGLARLAAGERAQTTLQQLLAQDRQHPQRQLIIIDSHGECAHWTGSECLGWCGSLQQDEMVVAGNLLAGPGVLTAMRDGFFQQPRQPLADRLLAALQAGEQAGGDQRGIRSAALQVWQRRRYADIDLRVDWSVTPLLQLAEVLQQVRAAAYMTFFQALPG